MNKRERRRKGGRRGRRKKGGKEKKEKEVTLKITQTNFLLLQMRTPRVRAVT